MKKAGIPIGHVFKTTLFFVNVRNVNNTTTEFNDESLTFPNFYSPILHGVKFLYIQQ